jgi:chemotaxis-related protein WspD
VTEKIDASQRLLQREVPEDLLRERTVHVANRQNVTGRGTKSIVIFRIGREWLGLATDVFQEISEERKVHTLPHRRGGILGGLVNVRGELLLCFSLDILLDLEPSPGTSTGNLKSHLLVCNRNGNRAAFSVSEVFGIHRYDPEDLRAVPATLANVAAGAHTVGMLSWKGRNVACLDDELVFYALNKDLA